MCWRDTRAWSAIAAHLWTFTVDPSLPAAILSAEIADAAGNPTTSFDLVDGRLRSRSGTRCGSDHRPPVEHHSGSQHGRCCDVVDTDDLIEIPDREPGVYEAVFRVPGMFLKAGSYTARIGAGTPQELLQDAEGARHVRRGGIDDQCSLAGLPSRASRAGRVAGKLGDSARRRSATHAMSAPEHEVVVTPALFTGPVVERRTRSQQVRRVLEILRLRRVARGARRILR